MRRRSLPVLVAMLAVLASCTARSPLVPDGTPAAHATTERPGSLTVVGDADPVAAAASTSRALFRSSDVVVLARAGDLPGTLLASSAAVSLGVPLLLAPGRGSTAVPDGEVRRLGAATVLAVGAVGSSARPSRDDGAAVREIAVPATPAGITAAGVRLGATRAVPGDGAAAAIAGLHRPAAAALVPDGAAGTASGQPAGRSGTLPAVAAGRPVDDVVVLATGAPETWAALATVRAAGARVQLTGGQADPRASSAVVTTLAQTRPRAVLALGAAFAGQQGLDWQLATATTGRQLPGGGQVVFPGRTLVALYGTPGTASLGVLGEQDLPASIERARAQAAAFSGLVPGPVVPTFEIIATVASPVPGPDGNYSTELDPDALLPWVQAAASAGVYVVLDLQPGRSDFLSQAQHYESLLRMPNVGLALDPEWRLGPGQLPLQQIGSVGIDEVNQVVTWLADLTRQLLLPQKLLVLHQFRTSMIRDRDRLDTSRQELAVVLHADGQGSQGSKQGTWATLHADLPGGPLSWGWKNFFDEDHPVLTPAETIAQVHPTPDLISFQ